MEQKLLEALGRDNDLSGRLRQGQDLFSILPMVKSSDIFKKLFINMFFKHFKPLVATF